MKPTPQDYRDRATSGWWLWVVVIGMAILWSNYSHTVSQSERITELEIKLDIATYKLSRCVDVLDQ
jgi:hypothetical protein